MIVTYTIAPEHKALVDKATVTVGALLDDEVAVILAGLPEAALALGEELLRRHAAALDGGGAGTVDPQELPGLQLAVEALHMGIQPMMAEAISERVDVALAIARELVDLHIENRTAGAWGGAEESGKVSDLNRALKELAL